MNGQGQQQSQDTPTSRLDEAVEWLTDWRAEHPGEVPAADLIAAAGEDGISTVTLHRARKRLGLRTRRKARGWVVGVEGHTSASSRTIGNAEGTSAPQAPVAAPTGSSGQPSASSAPPRHAPPCLPRPLGAQRHGAPAGAQPECVHPAARIAAVLASSEGDELAPQGAGLVWWALDNAGGHSTTLLGNLDGQRATVYLGVCSDCAATVVTVGTWDPGACGAGNASAWSSPWTPLCGDGRARLRSASAPRESGGVAS